MSDQLLATALAAAQAGARIVESYFRERDARLEVRAKAENDFVTRADRESEAAIRQVIHSRHPDHAILGEEEGLSGEPTAEFRWFVDPLDGTTNFLQGLPIFAVSIACYRRDEPLAAAILEPEGGHRYTAVRGGGARRDDHPLRVTERGGLADAFLATGYPFRAKAALDVYLEVFHDIFLEARAIRRCGSAALDLAYTAAGVFDGFFEFRLSPWDIAAGVLLVSEAGGVATDVDGGSRYLETGNLVCGAPDVAAGLQRAIAAHVDEAAIAALVPGPRAAPAGGRGDAPGDELVE